MEIEQLRANDRDATEREQSAEDALPFQSLLRQIKMSEDESEAWNGRLQDCRQAGRNILLAPEKQRVVDREHEDAGDGEQGIVVACRKRKTP